MNKRLFFIIGTFLVLVIFSTIVYVMLRDQPAADTQSPGAFPVVGSPTDSSFTGTTSGFFDDPVDASSQPVQAAPRLVKIADGPVAEGIVAISEPATSTGAVARVRYVERASGNIYEYRSDTRSIARLTNRTIPGVTEASWLSDGSRAYLRYLSTDATGNRYVETYTLSISGEGQLLSRNIAQVVPEGADSVLVVATGENGSVGNRAGVGGVGGTTVFSSALTRLFAFSTDMGVFVRTPASAYANSYVFSVTEQGGLSRIALPARGMSAHPSPHGTSLLASHVANGILELMAVNAQTQEQTVLPISTLSEKCSWSLDSSRAFCGVPASTPEGILPDDWYQGVIGFRDQLWEIDFESRLALFVADLPALTEAPIDAVSLAVDPAASMLFFINRNDGSLWAYELTGPAPE